MKKNFCDICGKEIHGNQIHSVCLRQNPDLPGVEVTCYEVCSSCLNVIPRDLVKTLLGIEGTNIQIQMTIKPVPMHEEA